MFHSSPAGLFLSDRHTFCSVRFWLLIHQKAVLPARVDYLKMTKPVGLRHSLLTEADALRHGNTFTYSFTQSLVLLFLNGTK